LDVDGDADERNVFLPGEASDSEDENENDEVKKSEERRRMLGNSDAQVSRLDISDAGSPDGYQRVNGGDAGNSVPRNTRSGSSLSAKAGIILVSYWNTVKYDPFN
jgi:solute carrier family 45 protein 1/2/4